MNPLTSLPPKVRNAFYWCYAVAGLTFGGLQVAQVDSLGGWPLVRIMAVYAYLGTALAVTAGSNVPSYADVVEGEVPPPDERGQVGNVVVIALAVIGVLAIIWALAGRG